MVAVVPHEDVAAQVQSVSGDATRAGITLGRLYMSLEDEQAACKIQAVWRGFRSRRDVVRHIEDQLAELMRLAEGIPLAKPHQPTETNATPTESLREDHNPQSLRLSMLSPTGGSDSLVHVAQWTLLPGQPQLVLGRGVHGLLLAKEYAKVHRLHAQVHNSADALCPSICLSLGLGLFVSRTLFLLVFLAGSVSLCLSRSLCLSDSVLHMDSPEQVGWQERTGPDATPVGWQPVVQRLGKNSVSVPFTQHYNFNSQDVQTNSLQLGQPVFSHSIRSSTIDFMIN